jgi:hypothetical protein
VTPVFYAGRQLIKVRGMMLLSLACAIGCVWAGIYLARTYGLSPGDGGVLAPLPVRLAWGIGVALLGIGFAAGMWLYGRCYVAKLNFDEQTTHFHIYTVRFFGSARETVALADIRHTEHHHGQLDVIRADGAGLSVNTPWQSITLADRWLPLIIDQQGTVLHPELMNAVLGTQRRPKGWTVR